MNADQICQWLKTLTDKERGNALRALKMARVNVKSGVPAAMRTGGWDLFRIEHVPPNEDRPKKRSSDPLEKQAHIFIADLTVAAKHLAEQLTGRRLSVSDDYIDLLESTKADLAKKHRELIARFVVNDENGRALYMPSAFMQPPQLFKLWVTMVRLWEQVHRPLDVGFDHAIRSSFKKPRKRPARERAEIRNEFKTLRPEIKKAARSYWKHLNACGEIGQALKKVLGELRRSRALVAKKRFWQSFAVVLKETGGTLRPAHIAAELVADHRGDRCLVSQLIGGKL